MTAARQRHPPSPPECLIHTLRCILKKVQLPSVGGEREAVATLFKEIVDGRGLGLELEAAHLVVFSPTNFESSFSFDVVAPHDSYWAPKRAGREPLPSSECQQTLAAFALMTRSLVQHKISVHKALQDESTARSALILYHTGKRSNNNATLAPLAWAKAAEEWVANLDLDWALITAEACAAPAARKMLSYRFPKEFQPLDPKITLPSQHIPVTPPLWQFNTNAGAGKVHPLLEETLNSPDYRRAVTPLLACGPILVCVPKVYAIPHGRTAMNSAWQFTCGLTLAYKKNAKITGTLINQALLVAEEIGQTVATFMGIAPLVEQESSGRATEQAFSIIRHSLKNFFEFLPQDNADIARRAFIELRQLDSTLQIYPSANGDPDSSHPSWEEAGYAGEPFEQTLYDAVCGNPPQGRSFKIDMAPLAGRPIELRAVPLFVELARNMVKHAGVGMSSLRVELDGADTFMIEVSTPVDATLEGRARFLRLIRLPALLRNSRLKTGIDGFSAIYLLSDKLKTPQSAFSLTVSADDWGGSTLREFGWLTLDAPLEWLDSAFDFNRVNGGLFRLRITHLFL